jgi:hypothetical protein
MRMNLRAALIDAFLSILHGMNPDKEKEGQPILIS